MQKIQWCLGACLLGFSLLMSGCTVLPPSSSSPSSQASSSVPSVTVPSTEPTSGTAMVTALMLLDEEADPLPERDGCFLLPPLCRIRAEFTGSATRADFWVKPTDEETTAQPRCVGSVTLAFADTEAAFSWRVPDGFIGEIWVLLYDGDAVQNADASLVCRAMSDSCV